MTAQNRRTRRDLDRRAERLRRTILGCDVPNHVDAARHALLLTEGNHPVIVERDWLYHRNAPGNIDFRGILAEIDEAQTRQSPKALPAIIWIDRWLMCAFFPMLSAQKGGQA